MSYLKLHIIEQELLQTTPSNPLKPNNPAPNSRLTTCKPFIKTCTGSYRFGFNGMEQDNELKGSGNSLDFGARIYDPRIGRWLSVDPLQAKYPNLSPYNFVANNPVIYIDEGGKDYEIVINHETKRIIVKATIYTTKSDAKEAQDAAMAWNSQSGKYVYVVESGEEKLVYEVEFELTVKPTEGDEKNQNWENRDMSYWNDKSGRANTYSVRPKGDAGLDGNAGQAIDNPMHPDRGTSIIEVEEGKQKERSTGSHEIGHILGLKHWKTGLMKDGSQRKDFETSITKGMVLRILNNGSIDALGTMIKTTDSESGIGDRGGQAKVKTGNDVGAKPDNFNFGTLRSK